MGLRGKERLIWTRDKATSSVVFYKEDGTVDHIRPFTTEEQAYEDGQAAREEARNKAQEARRASLAQLQAMTTKAAPTSVPALAKRVMVLEALVAALMGDLNG